MKRGWASVPGAVAQKNIHGVGCSPSGERRRLAGDLGATFDVSLPLLLLGCGRIFQPANVQTIARKAWTARNLEADMVTECGESAIFGPPSATNLDQGQ